MVSPSHGIPLALTIIFMMKTIKYDIYIYIYNVFKTQRLGKHYETWVTFLRPGFLRTYIRVNDFTEATDGQWRASTDWVRSMPS